MLQSFAANRSQSNAGAGASDPGTPGASGPSSGALQALSNGSSAVSILSKYAMSMQAASGLKQQALGEEMAGRQEYVQAQEKANAINAQYGDVAGMQMAIAAASGVDISSGSVTEARLTARQDADREIQIGRRNAETNAALRRARAVTLRQQSKNTALLGGIQLFANTADAFVSAGQTAVAASG